MCQIDWNLLSGAIQAIANALMALVAIAAAVYAYRQVSEASNARLTQVALHINSDIQTYRNEPTIRKLRKTLVDMLKAYPDDNSRVKALLADPATLDSVYMFMARINNLCWTISCLPANDKTGLRDSILSTIASNLVAEWDCLKPLAAHRCEERRTLGLDNGKWYMEHFESIAESARQRFPDATRNAGNHPSALQVATPRAT
jgi:hypothetical protein